MRRRCPTASPRRPSAGSWSCPNPGRRSPPGWSSRRTWSTGGHPGPSRGTWTTSTACSTSPGASASTRCRTAAPSPPSATTSGRSRLSSPPNVPRASRPTTRGSRRTSTASPRSRHPSGRPRRSPVRTWCTATCARTTPSSSAGLTGWRRRWPWTGRTPCAARRTWTGPPCSGRACHGRAGSGGGPGAGTAPGRRGPGGRHCMDSGADRLLRVHLAAGPAARDPARARVPADPGGVLYPVAPRPPPLEEGAGAADRVRSGRPRAVRGPGAWRGSACPPCR